MASPRAPPAPLAKHTEVPGFRADKGVDIRATAAQRRTSGAGLFAGIGPADDPKSPAAAPSPRAPLPPRGPTPSKASTLPSPSPAPAPATAGAKAPNAKSNTASPSKPAHTGRILGPPPQKDSSWFSCCRSSDVDEAATAATEEEAKAANHEGPQEDQPAAKTKAPAPKKSSADDDDASPAKSSVSAMAKLDESKLVRKQSVLNQPDKPPTPSTAAARSASFRGNPLSLSGSLGPASNPASPSALEATDRPSPAGGIRRLSSKATLQQQQTSSSEGGIRRAPSFSSASPGVSPASGVDATPSPTALRSDNGDLVKQVSLVARKSSFVMPSAQQSALPPRPSPSSQGASNDNAPPPLKGLGARPSSASGELQKSKKSSIVSGVSGASPSPPRDDATTSPGIGRARGGSTAGDVLGEGSSVLSMSASLGRAPRPPRPLNV